MADKLNYDTVYTEAACYTIGHGGLSADIPSPARQLKLGN